MMDQPPQAYSGPLFPAVIDSKNLLAAWEKVEENAGSPGVDVISVDVFGLTLEEEITRLQKELRDHTYRPQPLLRVTVNKPQGGRCPNVLRSDLALEIIKNSGLGITRTSS